MTTTIDYALMAGSAYRTTRDRINWLPAPQGWEQFFPVPDPTTATAFPVLAGFEAIAFAKGSEIVISYAGTDPRYVSPTSPDMSTNIALARGQWADQLLQAAEYYLQVKAANPVGTNITLTGHSLGGGLAALIAVFFGVQASTFDQAPFADSALFTSSNNNAAELLARLSARLDAQGNRVHSDVALAGLIEYLPMRSAGGVGYIPRSGLVTTIP